MDIKIINLDFGNAGDLQKPITTLIEKISCALGATCMPWQIKRIAQAEVEADLIRVEGEIKKQELQQRALSRFVAEETKKQINIESIIQKAIPQLEDSAKPDMMDNDWICNFFDKCKFISDEKMQQLWADILAGEANAQGSFSKRTINLVASLEKKDAQLFSALFNFVFTIDGMITPLIYANSAPIYQKYGVNFESLNELDAMGLIKLNSNTLMLLINDVENNIDKVKASYGKTNFLLAFSKGKYLHTGNVALTLAGKELSRICQSEPIDEFTNYVLTHWKNQGVLVTTIPD